MPNCIGTFFLEFFMCLICIEYNKKKMTREELKKALPEMVMFAKTENEKNHFKKLLAKSDSANEFEIEEFTSQYASKDEKK